MFIAPVITSNLFANIRPQNTNFAGQKYANIMPLSKDTVCFTGGKKDIRSNNPEDDHVGGINKTTAIAIHSDAERAYMYLDQKLDKILGDMVRPEHSAGSASKPIQIIRSRIKDVDSIIEKSITRKLDSTQEVKEGITDIVGARIVMANTTKGAVDKVIDRLTDAVKNNELKIIEIENYRPDPEMDSEDNIIKSYDYSSARSLKELKLACDDQLGTSIRKVDEDVPSGYMAIHMLVQLPNGFTGEIQILGREVERLKDIEDICYKVKNGKTVKKVPPKVKKMLAPLSNREDVVLRKEHNIYTRQAYIFQRELELQNSFGRRKMSNEFLKIPDYLPKNLDFNNLANELY